ncbi:MAG TPA: ribonuclease III [Marinilabiliales bacterium]|nr:ribonuclease III [Marinilabiliales bacterium]HAZ00753.1 ribonuclease III [Marinilabiliales bacterium]HBO75758.1 ribonuclease III [Marinilabiliales bacterium]HBX84875.1 ribonuclease III [Marinilabiliales bacterium]HBY54642.1 ribonuclease III [Marinilabiliales bacterium]
MLKGFISFHLKRLFSTDKAFYDELRRITGLYPKNEELYKLAFIHKSASLRLHDGMVINNERLEFLGDAILDAVVAEYLYIKFPDKKEGFLTQTRSKIVNGDYLAQLAIQLGLDKFIISHAHNYYSNKHILGDAFEALIGAIYLDHGYKAVKKFVFKQLLRKHIDLGMLLRTETNYKSRLIEWAQKDKKEVSFQTDMESNIGLTPEFVSFVCVDDKVIAKGKGLSKKEAEQNAARESLKNIPN